MTDKQIIIDGVDVSGCKWFCKWNSKCSLFDCPYGGHSQCDNGELYDCDHKQLKRKEQECEELKKTINEAKNSKLDLKSFLVGEAIQNEYEQQLCQLKKENEKLKKELEVTKGLVTVGNRQLAQALLELQRYKDKEQKEKEENEKLYKKLEGSCLIGKHWRFK